MRVRSALVCVGLAAVIASAGCKASGAGADTAGGNTAGGNAAGVDVNSAPVSAAALCAHLRKEAPRIKAVGSEVGAMAQLTMSIADLYGDHLDQLSGDVIDAQAVASCPETRAELVKAAGIKSFAEL
jgi:hypothetical protein